jgi:muconolactone delta-isomerase
MPRYLVERYLPGIGVCRLGALQSSVVEHSRTLRESGRTVRYLRSIFLPGEARCLCLFEAEDAELAKEVNVAAGFPYVRILNALDTAPEERMPP